MREPAVSASSDTHSRRAATAAALFEGVYAGRRVLVTGDTGFKGSWLCAWLDDLGATVGGYALEPPTEPSLFELLGLRGEVAHIARRRARPRRALGGGRGISPRGRLPPGRAAPGAGVVRRPARHPRDERDGCRQPVRGGARLSVRTRGRERDERQMLRERRDHPGIPRSRRPGRSRSRTARARAAPRSSARPTGAASSALLPQCAWRPREPATSSAVATGLATVSCPTA